MVKKIRLDQLMISKGFARSNKEAEIILNSKKNKSKKFQFY